jgi:hypothetical protein
MYAHNDRQPLQQEGLAVVDTGVALEKANISASTYLKKIEIVCRLAYWDQEKLFEEKNQRRKILWHCPFKYLKRDD